MTTRFDTLTLLTDLGTVDESVGVLRSVVRDLAPHVTVVDISHHLGAGDVRSASVMLARSVSYLPSGVVLVAVGAGITSSRRCVAVQIAGGEGVLVAPDNGVIAPAVAMLGGAEAAVVLDRNEFHLVSPGAVWPARDVLAPAAAHLCNGVELDAVGSPVDPGLLLPGVVPLSRVEGDALIADVLWIDRAGVCQLNVDPADMDRFGDHAMLTAGEHGRVIRRLGPGVPVDSLAAGSLGFLVDASGMISIVGAGRRAATELGVNVADQVVITSLDAGDRPSGATVGVRLRPTQPGPPGPRHHGPGHR